jgi:UDP:flavonoid glycosyltransferase YjiC (YdhE family)
MVIAEPEKLASCIAEAAKRTNTRVLIQSSWSKLAVSAEGEGGGKRLVYCLGNCPHDWLFPQMAAVVHHGGAGTVAAGLRAGKPTLVCPFFGDQFFWGEVTHRAGVGPPPIPAPEVSEESAEAKRATRTTKDACKSEPR